MEQNRYQCFTHTIPSLTSQNTICKIGLLFIQVKTLQQKQSTATTNANQKRNDPQNRWQEHRIPWRNTGVHVLTNVPQQRFSLVQQLAEGYSSVVSLLSCYWAVNSTDGSCLCVLIRSVTLNLGIDTWGDAERGKAAIYRPSIMTFIDDVTTGAWGFWDTHKHTHTQFVVRDWIHLFELCAPKYTLKHTPSTGFPS